ncbi:MAG: glycosyltransferase [Alistipes sp.]|nr:glycosyltransferase [Alistipes sp.]
MKLSIIVATYNRAESLIRTLNSVIQQEAPVDRWECVVVNNASTDDTEARVAEFLAEHPQFNIRLVYEAQQGLSFARNKGVAESKGRFVAFIDDDETINPEFISSYLNVFKEQTAFAAAGVVRAVYDNGRPSWMSKYPEKMIANPFDLGNRVVTITSKTTPAGGNMAFDREVFNIYGGFDGRLGRRGTELLGAEENDFFARIRALGERVYYVPTAIVYHHIDASRLTPEYFNRLAVGVGRSKRMRAEKDGRIKALLADEKKKWRYTRILAAFYILTFRPHKAVWLLRMRRGISQGINEK